jgi:hypothetical protein
VTSVYLFLRDLCGQTAAVWRRQLPFLFNRSGFPSPKNSFLFFLSSTFIPPINTPMENETQLPMSDDELRAENEVLRLKLEVDHGMKDFGIQLTPEAENQWLKSVYEFEEMIKIAGEVSIFDLINKPIIKPWYVLKDDALTTELKRILDLLDQNGIGLTKMDEYDDAIFYRIITEELLPMKFSEFRKNPIFKTGVG